MMPADSRAAHDCLFIHPRAFTDAPRASDGVPVPMPSPPPVIIIIIINARVRADK